MANTKITTNVIADDAVGSDQLASGLTLGGNTTFTGHVDLADSKYVRLGADADFIIYHDGTTNYVQAAKQDSDIILRGNDGGTGTNMLTMDTSAAGHATFNAGVTVGGNIANTSGDMLIDVVGDLSLDADGGDIRLLDGGTQFGKFTRDSGDFWISSSENDKDILFRGADGGADITALTLDMSNAGRANFNNDIGLSDNRGLRLGSDDDGVIYNDGSNTYIKNSTVNHDIIFQGNDDGSAITAMTIDMSVGGHVGIGTATPSQIVNVEATSTPVIEISTLDDNNPASASAIDLVEKQPTHASTTATFGQAGVYGYRIQLNGSDNTLRIKSGSQTTVTDRIILDRDTGNFGIGGAPSNKLEIRAASTVGTKNAHIMLTGDGATNGEGPQIVFSESGNSSNWVGGSIGFTRTGGSGVGDLLFGTRATAGDANTVTTERMRIDSAGKVGIGTASPAAKLHVYEETANTDTYSNIMRLESRSSGTTVAGFGGAIYFLGERNGDGGLQGMGRIVSYAEVNSGTDLSSGMAFHTATAGVPSEKLRISHNGDVTTTGAAYNRANAGFTARKGDSVTITRASGTPLEVNRTGSDGTIQNFFNDGAIAGSVGVDGTNLWFSAGGYTEKFRITSDGDVGIGATSPNAKLHLQDGANDYTSGLFLSNADSLSEASAIWHDNSGSTTLNIESRYGNAASAIKFTLQASSGSPVTAMTMLGNGIVTKPYTPAFSCNSSGDYTTTTGDQNIKTFACSNATTLNVGSHLSGGKFTAPVDGLYHFDLKAAATYSSGYLFLYVFKNGTGVSNHYHYMHQTSRSATLSFTIYAEEDDYFEPYVNTNYSGGTVNAIVFSGHFIG